MRKKVKAWFTSSLQVQALGGPKAIYCLRFISVQYMYFIVNGNKT
jgi:hypothetical protein